jgi:hypothetical protein
MGGLTLDRSHCNSTKPANALIRHQIALAQARASLTGVVR